MGQITRFVLSGCGLLVLLGCADGNPLRSRPLSSPQRTPTGALDDALASELAAHLVNGRLTLPLEASPAHEIASEEAARLALTYARQFGHFNRSIYERAAGFEIAFDQLEADTRVFLARSPY
jgi:hypothetical protein